MKCDWVDTVDDASFGYWDESWGDSPVHEFPCPAPAATSFTYEGHMYALCAEHAGRQ